MNLKQSLIKNYLSVRNQTEILCLPLMVEDYVIQSMEDVSPPKWHLAHTTWFFEAFILMAQQKKYQIFDPLFHHLFNSYYYALGQPYPRIKRGILSRPTVEKIYQYRQYVDDHMIDYLDRLSEHDLMILKAKLILGLNHEQQHQELLLMDIKHNFSLDPHFPAYHHVHTRQQSSIAKSIEWLPMEGGLVEIGYQGNEFCFDNELPRHQIILKPYLFANQLETNEAYLEFIEAGGYKNPVYWLSDGWEYIKQFAWEAPLYWFNQDNKWYVFTLSGLQEINLTEPVSHVSYYEADAYARWRGMRLPLEGEWEYFVANQKIITAQDNFLETNIFHPQSVQNDSSHAHQFFGDLWEWTANAYHPYPGYQPFAGELAEYNGKFMNNQVVLRGGSCVTPRSHIRASYRNFFQPDKRWQFSGIRLADHA